MNAFTHRVAAGGAICCYLMDQESNSGESTAWPVAGGFAGSLLTGLPDHLEPAIHPNHRQFFHSLTFAAVLGLGLAKLYSWEPETRDGHILRKLGMVALAAYLIHLALDATTAKSLPLLGKV